MGLNAKLELRGTGITNNKTLFKITLKLFRGERTMGNALENWGGRRIPEPPTQPAPERGDGGESDHLVSNRRLQAKGLRDPIGPCVVP